MLNPSEIIGTLLSDICLFRFIHLLVSKRMKDSRRSLNDAIFFISVGIIGLFWGICFARFMMFEGEHTTQLLIEKTEALNPNSMKHGIR